MINKKKVAIWIDGKDELKGKKGLIPQEEVEKIEKLLKENEKIDFLGNLNLKEAQEENGKVKYQDKILNELDLFFWYSPGAKSVLDKLNLLSRDVRVIKEPDLLMKIANKFEAHSILKKANLPVADFERIRFDNLDKMKKVIADWGCVLLKPESGSFGRGIVKICDFETLRDVSGLLYVEAKKEDVLVERFYENKLEDWISAVVIGGDVVYGYRKSEKKYSDWKVYDINKKGGDAYYVDPSPVEEFAKKAAKELKSSIVGFDFIKTQEGYKIVDENNFPGLYDECFKKAGLGSVSDVFVKLILEKLKL